MTIEDRERLAKQVFGYDVMDAEEWRRAECPSGVVVRVTDGGGTRLYVARVGHIAAHDFEPDRPSTDGLAQAAELIGRILETFGKDLFVCRFGGRFACAVRVGADGYVVVTKDNNWQEALCGAALKLVEANDRTEGVAESKVR